MTVLHPQIMKFVATFSAIAAAGLLVMGGIGVPAGWLLFLGATLAPSAEAIGVSVSTLTVFGAAATAAEPLVVTHWDTVKASFGAVLADLQKLLTDAVGWMEQAGINIIKALSSGMWKVATLPVEAIG